MFLKKQDYPMKKIFVGAAFYVLGILANYVFGAERYRPGIGMELFGSITFLDGFIRGVLPKIMKRNHKKVES